MQAHGEMVGVDRVADALALATRHRPALRAVRGDVTALPFIDASFDVVLDVTVTYAVRDDARAVVEFARVTRPGGAVLLFEPAFPALRRAHDATVHGVRRYRRRGLAALAEQAGLRVERSTYLYSFLAPAAAGLALADRIRPPREHASTSDVERRSLDRVFAPLASLERRWVRHHQVPFGTSAVVVATRPG
jgi:ubiquinone/menaquinone biosynthesis C-methylase UbiE